MTLRLFLLGSAAVLGAAPAASAANLPVPETDEMMHVCNAFGDGFFYIPNTDTCLRISGYTRYDTHYVGGDVAALFGGTSKSEFNNWTSGARGNVHFDAKTMSDFGLIRAYVELQSTIGPADFGRYSDANTTLPEAFIEVSNDHGVFTAGHTSSFFDFFGTDGYGTRIGIDDSTTEQTLFAYTLAAGNGLRGTLSVEDPDSSGRRLDGADDYEGQQLPDLVGNIHVEEKWGSAQVMGVVRQIHDVNGDGVGWAVSAGASVTLPVGGIGVSAQAGYADGALAYITADPGGIGDFSGPSGADTNQAWMLRAGLTAPFTDSLSGWLDGSFTHAEDKASNDSYDFWAFVVGAEWAPTDQLTTGPELAYNQLDGNGAVGDGKVFGIMWRVQASY